MLIGIVIENVCQYEFINWNINTQMTKIYFGKGSLLYIYEYNYDVDLLNLKKNSNLMPSFRIPGTEIKFYVIKDNIESFINTNKFKIGCPIDPIKFPENIFLGNPFVILLKEIIDDKKLVSDINLAILTKHKIGNKYFYDPKIKSWYFLNDNNRYILLHQEALMLKNTIMQDIPESIEEYFKIILEEKNKNKNDIVNLMSDTTDKKEIGYLTTKLNNINKNIKYITELKNSLISKFENSTSASKIVESLKNIYYDNDFSDKIDNINDKLLGFNNGVYDFENNVFRKPSPDEYISKSVGYDYEISSDKDKKEIISIISELFEDEEQLNYVLGSIALCLACEISDESFYIWIGSGRNGKGFLRDLIMAVFGEYFSFMSTKYFTGKIISNHDDEIFEKKGCRICILSEPIVNSRTGEVDADISFLKSLAGLDPQKGRAPYGKEPIKYKPKYKLFIQTNNYIKFPGSDEGITIKIRNVIFPYSFKKDDEYDPDNEYHKKANDNIKKITKNKKYVLAFLNVLIDMYNELKGNEFKLKIPQKFNEIKKDYIAENDPVEDFINNYLIKTNNENDFIKSSDVYMKFKQVMGDESNGISSRMFKEIMVRKGIQWKRTAKLRVFYKIKYVENNELVEI
jgi:putative DNA primase/helicase